MSYLHCEKYKENENLVERWCNDVEFPTQENYNERVYKIHKIGTEEYYDDAIDLPNDVRESMGLAPYLYEPTEIPVEKEDPEPDEEQTEEITE